MSAIGRLDLAHGLKKLLELTGSFIPSLGEGIVPVVLVSGLDGTPFSLAIPWVTRVNLGLVAAQFAQVAIVVSSVPPNATISIDKMYVSVGAGGFSIEPVTIGALPAFGSSKAAIRRFQIDTTTSLLPEVSVRFGNSVNGATGDSGHFVGVAGQHREIDIAYHIDNDGALFICGDTLASTMDVTIAGRIHFSTAR